jgi:hypothetical protein
MLVASRLFRSSRLRYDLRLNLTSNLRDSLAILCGREAAIRSLILVEVFVVLILSPDLNNGRLTWAVLIL